MAVSSSSAEPAGTRRASDSRADWPSRLALVLLVLALFREFLAGGVLYKRDVHLIWHPQIQGFVHAVREGALPLWDPSPAFGQPLLADPQAQVLYPPAWFGLLVPAWDYCTLYALLHVTFSALAFRALCRRWGLSPVAAVTGAAAWVLSGPFLSNVDLWHHLAGASYLPAVFLAGESALARRRRQDVLLLALVLGLQILAGSPDMCAMTLAAFAVWVAVVHVRWRVWRSSLSTIIGAAAALGLAATMSAGLWIAALAAVLNSSRHQLPEAVRTFWSLHPLQLVELFLAGIPGHLPLADSWRRTLFEAREPFLSSLYLGLPSLAFIPLAFSPAGRRRFWPLAGLALGAIAIALGRHAPFYDLATTVVPPGRVLRFPVKAMIVVAFAWAGLVAFGVDAWLARGWAGRRRLLAPLVIGVALAASISGIMLTQPAWAVPLLSELLVPSGLGLSAPVARSLAVHAAIGLVVLLAALLSSEKTRLAPRAAALCLALDLVFAHSSANPVAPPALYRHRPEVLALIGQSPETRVYSYDYADASRPAGTPGPETVHKLARLPAGWPFDAASALGLQMSLAPQTAGRWRLRQAFDVDYTGLQAEPLAYFTRLVRLREEYPEDLSRLLRLSSVTHVVALHRLGGDRLRLVGEVPGLFAVPVKVLAVPQPLPRARAVAGVRVVDGLDALFALVAPEFDPERTIVLPAGRSADPPAGFTGRVKIAEEKADRVRIEADLSHDGYVVLTDTYDAGWRVRLDGVGVPLLRANVAFRGVRVPAGSHVVEMAYRPPLVLAGVGVSIVTFLGLLVGLLWWKSAPHPVGDRRPTGLADLR